MNQVSLIPAIEESRNVLGILIDERPLRDHFRGRLGALPPQVSPLGWNESSREIQILALEKFLLEAPPDFENGRYAVLVCNECGDVACGAYSVRIERADEIVRWSEFGFEAGDASGVGIRYFSQVGPFEFRWREYESAFRTARARV